MRSIGRPLHLLFFHEPFDDDLINGRLHECRADRVTLPIAFAKVWNEGAIVANVGVEVGGASRQFDN